jgi:hypothetical protein
MCNERDENRLRQLIKRVRNEAVFRSLYQLMTASFESGRANVADVRDVLFLYDHFPIDDLE